MDRLKAAFDLAKHSYDRGHSPLAEIAATANRALQLLDGVGITPFGVTAGKHYSIFQSGAARSRPFLGAYLLDRSDYDAAWRNLIRNTNTAQHRFNVDEHIATAAIYTAVMSFALCYDLWKPKSRKTPGTFLEVVLGSILATLAPEAHRKKFIALRDAQDVLDLPQGEIVARDEVDEALAGEDEEEDESTASSVSTDIVFEFDAQGVRKGIVIPAKITTRERIVQPFAHQRILDSAFGQGRYVSMLACVSETQRDDRRSRVNEICVPGTIELFQRHLAKLSGIYYLDPPDRYLRLAAAGVIEVRSVGQLLVGDFDAAIRRLQTTQAARQPR